MVSAPRRASRRRGAPGVATALARLLCARLLPSSALICGHWVAPVYLVEDCVGEPAVLEPDKLGGCGWFPLDALPFPLTSATVAAVKAQNTPQ